MQGSSSSSTQRRLLFEEQTKQALRDAGLVAVLRSERAESKHLVTLLRVAETFAGYGASSIQDHTRRERHAMYITLFGDDNVADYIRKLALITNIPLTRDTYIQPFLERIGQCVPALAKVHDIAPAIVARVASEWRTYLQFCDADPNGYHPVFIHQLQCHSVQRYIASCVTFANMYTHPFWTSKPLDAQRHIHLPAFGKIGTRAVTRDVFSATDRDRRTHQPLLLRQERDLIYGLDPKGAAMSVYREEDKTQAEYKDVRALSWESVFDDLMTECIAATRKVFVDVMMEKSLDEKVAPMFQHLSNLSIVHRHFTKLVPTFKKKLKENPIHPAVGGPGSKTVVEALRDMGRALVEGKWTAAQFAEEADRRLRDLDGRRRARRDSGANANAMDLQTNQRRARNTQSLFFYNQLGACLKDLEKSQYKDIVFTARELLGMKTARERAAFERPFLEILGRFRAAHTELGEMIFRAGGSENPVKYMMEVETKDRAEAYLGAFYGGLTAWCRLPLHADALSDDGKRAAFRDNIRMIAQDLTKTTWAEESRILEEARLDDEYKRAMDPIPDELLGPVTGLKKTADELLSILQPQAIRNLQLIERCLPGLRGFLGDGAADLDKFINTMLNETLKPLLVGLRLWAGARVRTVCPLPTAREEKQELRGSSKLASMPMLGDVRERLRTELARIRGQEAAPPVPLTAAEIAAGVRRPVRAVYATGLKWLIQLFEKREETHLVNVAYDEKMHGRVAAALIRATDEQIDAFLADPEAQSIRAVSGWVALCQRAAIWQDLFVGVRE